MPSVMDFPLHHSASNTETQHRLFCQVLFFKHATSSLRVRYRCNVLSMSKGQYRNTTNFLLLLVSSLLAYKFNIRKITCLHLRGERDDPGKWATSELHWGTAEGMSYQASLRHRNNVAMALAEKSILQGSPRAPIHGQGSSGDSIGMPLLLVRNLVSLNSA